MSSNNGNIDFINHMNLQNNNNFINNNQNKINSQEKQNNIKNTNQYPNNNLDQRKNNDDHNFNRAKKENIHEHRNNNPNSNNYNNINKSNNNLVPNDKSKATENKKADKNKKENAYNKKDEILTPRGNIKNNNNSVNSNPYEKANYENLTPRGNARNNNNPVPSNPYEKKNYENLTPAGKTKINQNNDLTPMGNTQSNINRDIIISNNTQSVNENESYENKNNNSNKIGDSNSIQNLPFSFNQYTKPSLVKLDYVNNALTYISSPLRCLANIKPIIKYYLEQLDSYRNHANDMPLSYHFDRLIFNLYPYPQNSLNTSFSLQTFYKAFLYLNPSFRGKSIKNPIEFIIYLLELLHNDDKRMLNNKNDHLDNNIQKNQTDFYAFIDYLKKYEKSIIFTLFGWINQKIAVCTECKEENNIFREFFTFDLNIENTLNKLKFENRSRSIINIYDCIKYQSHEETLYNNYCNNCKKKNIVKLKTLIKILPNYFIFLIKLNNKEIIQKLENEGHIIKIEKIIDLDKLIKESNINSKFELVGMVVYNINNNMEEYISYCCHPIDDKWYKFDLNNINQIDINKILEQNDLLPVILFYKSKNLKKN